MNMKRSLVRNVRLLMCGGVLLFLLGGFGAPKAVLGGGGCEEDPTCHEHLPRDCGGAGGEECGCLVCWSSQELCCLGQPH
jgi:hypothetical protein